MACHFRLKSKRLLDGVLVKEHDQRPKQRWYTRVRVPAADDEQPRYYRVCSLSSELSTLPETVRVFISRRHHGDTRPRHYDSTDVSLSAHQALTWFHERWSCEVANWYIAERLGWPASRWLPHRPNGAPDST